MKLQRDLPQTAFKPPRGYGKSAVPDTGAQSLPYSTFQTSEEVKADPDLLYEDGRLFLGRIDDQMIGVRDNRHIVTVAGSRAGKSVCLLMPNLRLYPGAALVIDPKGELAENSAVFRDQVLGHHVVILDPFEVVKGEAAKYVCGHDPFRDLDKYGPDLIDDAAAMAEALVVDTGGDAHWTMAGRNLLGALILLAKLGYGERTLSDLRLALARDPEALWAEMAALGPREDDPGPYDEALAIIESVGRSFSHKNPTEAASIVSSALEQLTFAQSPAMRRLFATQGMDLSTIKTGFEGKPVTLYVVLPAGRIGTHNRWLRLLVTMALVHFERLPTDRGRHPILMVLEEFAALGHLRPVERAAGFIAGSGVRLWSVLQDLSQLKYHYKDAWETFIGNAGVLQAFSVSDLTTCEYLSKRLGDATVEVTIRHPQSSADRNRGLPPERREFRSVPLLNPSEIALTFARRDVEGVAAGGLSLVLTPDRRPFVVDRVFWKTLTEA